MNRNPGPVSSVLLFLLFLLLAFALSGLAPTVDQIMGW